MENRASGRELHALFFELHTLIGKLSEITDSIHERAGLRSPQLRILRECTEANDMTVPRIAEKMGVSRQFVQTECDILQKQGLVAFMPNPHHKRSQLVVMTEKGRERREIVHKNEDAIILDYLPDLDAGAVKNATTLVKEISRRFDQLKS